MIIKDKLIAFYSGSGIGLAIGVLMGLAASPTVGVMIGALATILAVLLGLNDSLFSNSKAVRVGSFGFAWVVGVFLGMFIRTHNFLSPSPSDLVDAYVEVGFNKQQALAFVAYKEFGIVHKDWKLSEVMIESSSSTEGEQGESSSKVTGSLTRIQHTSSLFSADVELNSCINLEDLESLPTFEIVNNFVKQGGSWQKMAELANDELGEVQTKTFLLAAHKGICKQSPDALSDSACLPLQPFTVDTPYLEIRQGFTSTQGVWNALAVTLDETLMHPLDLAKALWIEKTVLCSKQFAETNS